MTCVHCDPAPSAESLWRDVHDAAPAWRFAGIVGDSAHATRISSHNCAPMQESALRHPVTGHLTPYPPCFAHALDGTYDSDLLGAARLRNATLLGPRKLDIRYIIDHRTTIIYYPEWRGGGTGNSSIGVGEPHLHWSLSPWSTMDTRDWFQRTMTPAERARLVAAAQAEADRRVDRHGVVCAKRPYARFRGIAEVQAVLNRPVHNPYGPGTAAAVKNFQTLFGVGTHHPGCLDRPTWAALIFVYLAHGLGF